MRPTVGRLPFSLAVLIVAALTAVVIAVGTVEGLGRLTLVLFVVPVAFAVVYLLDFRRLPGPEPSVRWETTIGEPAPARDPSPVPPSTPVASPVSASAPVLSPEAPPTEEPSVEPFEDPVEEADRLAVEEKRERDSKPGTEPDDEDDLE